MNSSQLVFDFSAQENKSTEVEFVIHENNAKAVAFLDKFFIQKDGEEIFKSAIIKGESCSGKTNMITTFSKKYSVAILDKESLQKEVLSSFFVKNKFYILEDVDKLKDDNLLFHILNAAQENGAFLLMSAEDLSVFELKDLKSRINNIFVCEIEKPSENSIKMLFLQGFALRQLKISDSVIDFLTKNTTRSYKKIYETVNAVEGFCYEKGSDFTLKDAKNIINL